MSLIHKVSDIFEERNGITSIHKSWKTVEIDKICTIQNGYALKSKLFNKDGEGRPIIRIRDISHSNPQTFYSGEFPEPYLVKKGDLLVGMDGDFNAEIWNGPVAILNQRVCRLFPNTDFINSKFLYYGIQGYLNKINENTSSTTVKHLSSRSIKEIPFPLPPRPEQDRIVTKVDALMGQVSVMQESLQRIPQLLKDFRQQVLTQAVTGKLTEEWREGKDINRPILQKLENLGIWRGGGTPSKSIKRFWIDGKVLWITPKDMKSTIIKDSKDKITNEAVELSSAKLIPPRSILFVTRSGILRRLFPICSNMKETTVNQDIKALTVKSEYDWQYILFILRGLEFDLRAKCMKSGTTVESVDFKKLKNYQIPIPNKIEQQEIVNRVESLFSKADAIQKQYEALKQKIDTLPQAILHKAFKGELVEQLESDGSAEELLREIEELKSATIKKKK